MEIPYLHNKMSESEALESLADNELPAEGIDAECASALESNDKKEQEDNEKQKVDILLKPTGNAPIMKKKKWAVDANKQIGWIMEFIKKYLKLEAEEKLFLYVNQTFAPSPDQTVRNLFNSYSTEGKLVLHYCRSQAWG